MTTSEQYELYPDQFHCPKCFAKRPYGVKRVSVRTHFYYIALFETGNLEYVVECKACKKAFDPGILKPYNQNLIKLAGAAKYQMLKGASPENLKEELSSAGFKDEFADRLIMLAQI